MSEHTTPQLGPKGDTLPEDTTPEAKEAAAARQKDYEATVKWNEKDRAKPGIGG